MNKISTILLVGSISLTAQAAPIHPLFGSCGEYRITALFECPRSALPETRCRLKVAPGSNSEALVFLNSPVTHRPSDVNRWVSGVFVLSRLSTPLAASLSGAALLRALPDYSSKAVKLLKEETCLK